MTAQYVMPLSAMCQIVTLIQKLAKFGQFNDLEVSHFLSSIVNLTPASPADVYEDQFALKAGYRTLVKQLSAGGDKDVELVKYVGGLMQLERALANNTQALNTLATRLKDVERQLEHYSITDPIILSAFADIYGKVLSPLTQRIQVYGKTEILKETATQHKVRALLLAGVRSAVLWRQLGGKRRHFFFNKKRIIAEANNRI